MALSLYQADSVKADTNFDAVNMSDTELMMEKNIMQEKGNGKIHNDTEITRIEVKRCCSVQMKWKD